MNNFYTGNLRKMKTAELSPVQYVLQLGEERIEMNTLLGKSVKFTHTGKIFCINCGNKTKKSFAQGFCYMCFVESPNNSPCIINPELCEGHLGKGRDVEWEQKYHVQPHIVYLALTNIVKVGVTREPQIPNRWIDQGAREGLVFARVPYRQLAGAIEVVLKQYVTDRTSWQRMLKNDLGDDLSLEEAKEELMEYLEDELQQYITFREELVDIEYPVLEYPEKIKSLSFDKTPEIEQTLVGIRGQYLMFEGGQVLNIRKFTGYNVDFAHG